MAKKRVTLPKDFKDLLKTESLEDQLGRCGCQTGTKS